MPGYEWVTFKGKNHIKIGSHLFTLAEIRRAERRNKAYMQKKRRK